MKHVKIVVLLLSSLFVVACSSETDAVSAATAWEGPPSTESIAVEALTASTGSLIEAVSASGLVAGVNEALVLSETQGIIRKVSFVIGDTVVTDQSLVLVDDSILSLNLQRAKDQLDSAVLELRANEELSSSGGTSAVALTRVRSAESAARAQYEIALKSFRDATIRAPISGIIASREETVTLGNIISPFARVARIVDNSSFKITVGVGEREIGLIETGAKAKISIPSALGTDTVNGTVTATGAGSDPGTGSFPVVVSFPNSWGNRVKSGMSASVEIESKRTAPSVLIPLSALLRKNGKTFVFIEENGLARSREIRLGRSSGVRVEVLYGLKAGDVLIISAMSRLVDGVSVTPTLRGSTAARE